MIPKYIVLHHSLTKDSGTVSWQAIRRYHLSKSWDDIGYHFGLELINNCYEILMGRMVDQHGAHCPGMNQRSLGIMFCGNFNHRQPESRLWTLGIKLVRSLIHTYGIPVKKVIGHHEYAEGRTCPGRMFDLAKFRTDLLI